MRLLVSLRAAEEVAAALAGGADIIDAKEPAHGSLGPVAPHVLRAISRRVPPSVPLSMALGDFTDVAAVRHAVRTACRTHHHGPVYLKLGFARGRSGAAVSTLVSAAVQSARHAPSSVVVVPVAYADSANAASPPPEEVLSAAIRAGAGAFLVDTYNKDGKGLLDWLDLDHLRSLAARGRAASMLVAVAGSLDLEGVERVAGLADIVGVRGAACRGGRGGTVDASLVRRLRERLAGPPAAAVAV